MNPIDSKTSHAKPRNKRMAAAVARVAFSDDILTEIFPHLRPKILARLKLVSKRWNSLISDPHLMRNRPPRPADGLVFPALRLLPLIVAPFDHPQINRKSITFSTNQPFADIEFLHGCNGLLLCSGKYNRDLVYFVINPTTSKSAILPDRPVDDYNDESMKLLGMCLAFDPSESPSYKVVCVSGSEIKDEPLPRHVTRVCKRFEVYSSETFSWRIITIETPFVGEFDIANGSYWNRALHWITKPDPRDLDSYYSDHRTPGFHTIYLDPQNETHSVFPSPPTPQPQTYTQKRIKYLTYFGESCGHLHFVTYECFGGSLEVYEMSRDYSGWFLKYSSSNVYISNADRNLYGDGCIHALVRGKNDEDCFLIFRVKESTWEQATVRYNIASETYEKWHDDPLVPWHTGLPLPYFESIDGMANNHDTERGIRAPLVANGGRQKTRCKEDRCMVYFSTFVAVCGSYSFGSCIGYSSPTQTAIREDLNLSLAEYSLFGSILTFGAMIGAITSGTIADFIGRKGAMIVSSGFCTFGWLSIYSAQGPLPLDVGRLATGYGMGIFSYVVPVFIAEIAPKDLRGALTTINQLMICTGVSVSFVVGTFLTWRTLALVGIVPCGFLLIGLCIIPESPRWLAKQGDQEEFEAALRKLRGKDAEITIEAAEIRDYIETLESLPKAKLLDLFQRRYLRSVTIGVGLMVCQQFGGINGVSFYTSSIFESSGFPSDVGTVIYAILQIIVTGLGAILIDRAGRKPLLVVSGTGLVLGCLLTGSSFYLKGHGLALEAVPALAVTGISVFIAAFSAGMGAVPWVIMSEIFPINIKGTAGSLATLVNWMGAWAVSYTFNFLMSWSSHGTFVLYALANALAIVFVIKVVPETKGRTLEQIQSEL